MGLVYKILGVEEWRAAEIGGAFFGSEVDRRDGFIHFSDASQSAETAAKWFAGRADLVLVAIDADRLGANLKWERSRGGQLFPHLYAPLPLKSVVWMRPLPLGPDGAHAFPDLTA